MKSRRSPKGDWRFEFEALGLDLLMEMEQVIGYLDRGAICHDHVAVFDVDGAMFESIRDAEIPVVTDESVLRMHFAMLYVTDIHVSTGTVLGLFDPDEFSVLLQIREDKLWPERFEIDLR
jgi:hypothetical protein